MKNISNAIKRSIEDKLNACGFLILERFSYSGWTQAEFYLCQEIVSGTNFFVKICADSFSEIAKNEQSASQYFASLVARNKCSHLDVGEVYRIVELGHGLIAEIQHYAEGQTLDKWIAGCRPFTPEESACLRNAFFELFMIIHHSSFYHRDILLQNLVFSGKKLCLIDFQWAYDKMKPVIFRNPTTKDIWENKTFIEDAHRNDALALYHVYKACAPYLTCAKSDIMRDLSLLESCADKEPTIEVIYAFNTWGKRKFVFAYWFARLIRPLWSFKPKVRLKRIAKRALLREIIDASNVTL